MAKRAAKIVDFTKLTSNQLRRIVKSTTASTARKQKAYGILVNRNAVHSRVRK